MVIICTPRMMPCGTACQHVSRLLGLSLGDQQHLQPTFTIKYNATPLQRCYVATLSKCQQPRLLTQRLSASWEITPRASTSQAIHLLTASSTKDGPSPARRQLSSHSLTARWSRASVTDSGLVAEMGMLDCPEPRPSKMDPQQATQDAHLSASSTWASAIRQGHPEPRPSRDRHLSGL